MNITVLNDSNFDSETSTGVTLVDFYADWCGPCRTLNPVLESLANSLTGEAKVVKVNVDESPTLAQKYEVRGIPTLIVINNGKVVNRKTGGGTEVQLLNFVRSGKETI